MVKQNYDIDNFTFKRSMYKIAKDAKKTIKKRQNILPFKPSSKKIKNVRVKKKTGVWCSDSIAIGFQ